MNTREKKFGQHCPTARAGQGGAGSAVTQGSNCDDYNSGVVTGPLIEKQQQHYHHHYHLYIVPTHTKFR